MLTQTELLDEPSVIVADIGGWTVDLMRLDNRIPNAATCRSLELGMIRCLDEIGEKARQMFGVSMTDVQIESILRGGAVSVDDRIRLSSTPRRASMSRTCFRPSWRAAWMCAPCLPSSWEAGRRS